MRFCPKKLGTKCSLTILDQANLLQEHFLQRTWQTTLTRISEKYPILNRFNFRKAAATELVFLQHLPQLGDRLVWPSGPCTSCSLRHSKIKTDKLKLQYWRKANQDLNQNFHKFSYHFIWWAFPVNQAACFLGFSGGGWVSATLQQLMSAVHSTSSSSYSKSSSYNSSINQPSITSNSISVTNRTQVLHSENNNNIPALSTKSYTSGRS